MSGKDQRISESTVARIAGNIAAGFVGKLDWRSSATVDAVATDAVALARAIVAEVERTAKEQA